MTTYNFDIQHYKTKNKRYTMEDYISLYNNKNNNIFFSAVFDGHSGEYVSKYLYDNMYEYFSDNVIERKKNILKIFSNINKDIKKNIGIRAKYCGSTCVCLLINLKTNTLIISNLGDSRAIIINNKKKVVFKTSDHKPNSSKEKNRIKKLGGRVYFDGHVWRIGNLSLSRAFGDLDSHPYISDIPDISIIKCNKNYKYIVLASDGFWDVVSNEKCALLIGDYIKKISIENIPSALVDYAIDKGSKDNISIILIHITINK